MEPWTLIIDDAMASSFVSPVTDSIEDDAQLIGKVFNADFYLNFNYFLYKFDAFFGTYVYISLWILLMSSRYPSKRVQSIVKFFVWNCWHDRLCQS